MRTARALIVSLLALLSHASSLSAQASADLSVTVSDAPDPVLDGGQVTYTIVVTNSGPDAAQDIRMVDFFPPAVSFVSLDKPAGWACDTPAPVDTSISCTVATLASGGVATFTLVLDNGVQGSGVSISDSASVGATSPDDPDPGDNSATTTTAIQAWADLSVVIADDPDPVLAGAGLIYTITVSSGGPDAVAATLSDPLPPGTTFSGLIVPTGWDCSTPALGTNGTVSCFDATAFSSETFTLFVRVDVATPSGTVLKNTASLSSESFDPTTADQTATATTTVSGVVSPATLSATKTVAGDFSPGGRVTYTVVLHNSGPAAQNDNFGPEFQDILVVGLTAVSASATSGTVQASSGGLIVVTWDGAIPAGGSVTIAIQATIDPSIPRGTVLFNQGTTFYDADGDGTNEALGATDDPTVRGTEDPTLFTVGVGPLEIPTLDRNGLILLILLLAVAGAMSLRRHSQRSSRL